MLPTTVRTLLLSALWNRTWHISMGHMVASVRRPATVLVMLCLEPLLQVG